MVITVKADTDGGGTKMPIKFGCQGTTWVLDYDLESDNLNDLMDTVEEAGFKGIDVQIALLGRYKDKPEMLKEELERRGLELAALTVPFTWENDVESADEKKLADYYINYLKHFPGAILNLPARNGPNRDNLLKRQQDIISCANAVGKRAYENGIVASFHPASPKTSYFRYEEDYTVLLEGLDTKYIGYTPDAGHITFGGMDALELIKKYLPIIRHVHFKEATNDFVWKKMGEGDIDFPGIVKALMDYNYKGWIIVEEETAEAATNTHQVVMDIGDYVETNLMPIVKGE